MLVRLFNEMEDELQEIDSNLKKMKRIHKFCTATEIVASLDGVRGKLARMELNVAQMIPSE